MQIPGKNWNATSWLLQYFGAHWIIHFALCTASLFWWTASRLMQYLGDDYVIHFMLRVARFLLKAAQHQKECRMCKLGPTPDLWKQSQLTILIVIFVLSPPKLVKICYLTSETFWLCSSVMGDQGLTTGYGAIEWWWWWNWMCFIVTVYVVWRGL
jgi:hypothetical protein